MNILVCDDDLSIANSIAKYIKNKFKHEVFVSINREEALNVIHSENIDLLIIDIVLKDDNGIFLAEDIQKNQSNIKIIFITAMEMCTMKIFTSILLHRDFSKNRFSTTFWTFSLNKPKVNIRKKLQN